MFRMRFGRSKKHPMNDYPAHPRQAEGRAFDPDRAGFELPALPVISTVPAANPFDPAFDKLDLHEG